MMRLTVLTISMAVFGSAMAHTQDQSVPESNVPSDAEIPQILIDRNPGVVL